MPVYRRIHALVRYTRCWAAFARRLLFTASRTRRANRPGLQGALAARPGWQGSPFKRICLRAVARRLLTGQRGRISAGKEPAKLNQLARSGAGWATSNELFSRKPPTLRREATVFAPPASRFYFPSSPTAGVTGKGGIWRTKPPDAESAVWSRFPESAGRARTCPVHAMLARRLQVAPP